MSVTIQYHFTCDYCEKSFSEYEKNWNNMYIWLAWQKNKDEWAKGIETTLCHTCYHKLYQPDINSYSGVLPTGELKQPFWKRFFKR